MIMHFRIAQLRKEVDEHIISTSELHAKEKQRDIVFAENTNTIEDLKQELREANNTCESLRSRLRSVDQAATEEYTVICKKNEDLSNQ